MAGPRRFPTTRWSVVAAASGTTSNDARDALATLCETYWAPVHEFIRQSGRETNAKDLTQGFFTRLVEKGDYRNARLDLGRFRTFLLTAVRHFLANQHDFDRAAKRGGAIAHIAIDASETSAGGSVVDPASADTPETVFERQWALTSLEAATDRLAAEYRENGHATQFAALRPFLTGSTDVSYADVAGDLGLAEGSVRVAVHRLRKRYGACLRDVLAETLRDPAEVDGELDYLFKVVTRDSGRS